jgi:periplasmic protein CpxP/Spy
MSEQVSKSPSSPEAAPVTPRRWLRGGVIALAVVGALVLVVGGGGAIVYAMGGGWRGHMSVDMAERVELGVKYALRDTDATDEQREQVTSILQATAIDVHALMEAHAGLHQQLHDVLTAETVDRARLETVRAEGVSLADQATKRLARGMADAADILTTQQRAALSQRLEERNRWHRDHD